MDFVRLANGNYVNAEILTSFYAIGASTTWNIEVDLKGVGHGLYGGPYPSEAAAQDVIKQLINGRSPEDYD